MWAYPDRFGIGLLRSAFFGSLAGGVSSSRPSIDIKNKTGLIDQPEQ